MIGPSAPNGPPVPMATAADTGLAIAVRGEMRLSPVSTASCASGDPVAADVRRPQREEGHDERAGHCDEQQLGPGW